MVHLKIEFPEDAIAMQNHNKIEQTELIDFLKQNGMDTILNKICANELTSNNLINLSDEKILELIEEENKDKFPSLRDLIMKLNDQSDAINVLYIVNQGMSNEA